MSETMGRGTGSKSLAIAALVSLIIHGGIFLAYAFIFRDAGSFKSYQPLMVALIPTAELEKPAALPLRVAKKEPSSNIKEDQVVRTVPVNLVKDREDAPPRVGTLPTKAAGEAAARQEKNQERGDLATAYLPATDKTTEKSIESGINSQGTPGGTASRGEISLSGYSSLETSRSGGFTSAIPRYSENYLPDYPLPARRRGYAGLVMLSVEVLVDGSVGRLEMKKTSGYDLLDKSAWETVKGWKFSPAKKMGIPVTMWVDVPVKFELN